MESCTLKSSGLPNRFGLYIHIPFCIHRCSYCDFYSLTQYTNDDFERLTQKIIWELDEASRFLRTRSVAPVNTIFFGGGTPSLLPVPLLRRILDAVHSNFNVQDDAEITIEANPETVDHRFLSQLRETRVNRISLGAQSFDSPSLARLERNANETSIRKAVQLLGEYGYTNFNLDLIFGIPGQSDETLIENIDKAASLGPNHLSFYQLTLKQGHTLFPELPSDDKNAGLYEVGVERLKTHGYSWYEISNFSKPGAECLHNLLYWDGSDFLGVGPSASGRFFWDGVFHHRKQYSDLKRYFETEKFLDPPFESTTKPQTVLEAVFLELRKRDGIEFSWFQDRYGLDLRSAKNFKLLKSNEMLLETESHITLTPKGRLLADSVASYLTN